MKMIVLSMLRQAFLYQYNIQHLNNQALPWIWFLVFAGHWIFYVEINAECKNAEKMQNMHAYYMYYNILLYVKPCHGHVTSKFYHHAKKLQEISFK